MFSLHPAVIQHRCVHPSLLIGDLCFVLVIHFFNHYSVIYQIGVRSHLALGGLQVGVKGHLALGGLQVRLTAGCLMRFGDSVWLQTRGFWVLCLCLQSNIV